MKSSTVELYKNENLKIYNKSLGIIFNGHDNMKPTIIENMIDASPTAVQCADINQSFLSGGGFEQPTDINISDDFWEDYYPNDLLFDVAESCSRHRGVFIHINYNAAFEKENFKVIPYTLCRLGKEDSKDYIGKVLVSPNGWGKSLKKTEIDVIDSYNPRPEIIMAQVEKAGGWENYKGQILYFKFSKKYLYGKSPLETSYKFADVENSMGDYYSTTVHRGFNDVKMFRHRAFPSRVDEEAFKNDAKKVMGADGSASVWMVQDDWDDEGKSVGNIKVENLSTETKAEKYKHFEESSSNFIRKAWKIPQILVDAEEGKLGNSSGESLKVACDIYNRTTLNDRQKLSRLFKELFWNFKQPIESEWKIIPFTYGNGVINQ